MPALASSAPRKRQIASLVCNLAIVAMELAGLNLSIKMHGAGMIRFYTQDSNLFAMVACAILAVCTLRTLRNGETLVPAWVTTLKFTATSCLAVTFVVVLFVLAPDEPGGYAVMFLSGSMLYDHLLCPILALVSFIFLETDAPLGRRPVWWAFFPTVLYAAVTLTLNVASVLDGPYPFLRVREQPVLTSILWVVLILGGAYLLAWLILLANRKCAAHRK
jgi:hypothetical protein